MSNRLIEMFEDEKIVEKIKDRLPYFFQLAEIESSRGGRIGMEIGSLRERIVAALLIYKFGERNVDTEIPINEPGTDLKLFGHPISIKTITSKRLRTFKLSWTVDAQKAKEFCENYSPHCDILFVQINWNAMGKFYCIPVVVQKRILKKIGAENYFKLPKPGTNPRGIEISKKALLDLVEDRSTKAIEIFWQRSEIDYNAYKRWVDYWREEK